MKNQITSSHWQEPPLPTHTHAQSTHTHTQKVKCTVHCIWRNGMFVILDCMNLGLLSRLPISPLNVNVKTDSGTDGSSSSLLRHSRWEVSASQPHIHFPFHSSCKSNLADFFCLHIFLSPSHPLSLASLIVSCRSTSCSLINYLKNIHSPRVLHGLLILYCFSVPVWRHYWKYV